MMLAILALLCVFGFYALWVHFLAVMRLQDLQAVGKLQGSALWLGRVVLGVGLVLDLLWQLLPASLYWMELPRELTVSGRVKRLCTTGSGWRKARAESFRDVWLKPFDASGGHD
jgi:hypothetical protein